MSKQVNSWTLIATAAILSGCAAAQLKPAPSAQRADGEDTAIGRSNGVNLVVETDAWSSYPPSLERQVTPVRATIVNNSEHAVEVKYEHFSLNGFNGVTYHPLPPINIKGRRSISRAR